MYRDPDLTGAGGTDDESADGWLVALLGALWTLLPSDGDGALARWQAELVATPRTRRGLGACLIGVAMLVAVSAAAVLAWRYAAPLIFAPVPPHYRPGGATRGIGLVGLLFLCLSLLAGAIVFVMTFRALSAVAFLIGATWNRRW